MVILFITIFALGPGVKGQRLCWGVQGGKVSLKLLDLWHFKSPKPYFFTKKFDFFISINILKSLFITIPESGCKTVDIENVAEVTSYFSKNLARGRPSW